MRLGWWTWCDTTAEPSAGILHQRSWERPQPAALQQPTVPSIDALFSAGSLQLATLPKGRLVLADVSVARQVVADALPVLPVEGQAQTPGADLADPLAAAVCGPRPRSP